MRFGLRIPPCESPAEVAKVVHAAEVAGFDTAWVPDSQLLWRDVWVTLGAAAVATSRIELGTNVTNPVTRHATVTACASSSMQELSDGRFVLGIGSGDSSVRVMGLRPARIEDMRGYIRTVRQLAIGEEATPHDRPVRMIPASGMPVPVYISATGPRMLRFAGEVGDGVIILAGIAKDSLDRALGDIEQGADAADRSMGDIRLITGLFCYVGDDWRSALKLAQPYAALYALRYKDLIPDFDRVVPDEAALHTGLYPDLGHAADWSEAIERTEWLPEDVLAMFVEKYCLMGTASEVARKVELLASYGVTDLYVRGFYSYSMPTDVLRAFGEEVIPRLKVTVDPQRRA